MEQPSKITKLIYFNDKSVKVCLRVIDLTHDLRPNAAPTVYFVDPQSVKHVYMKIPPNSDIIIKEWDNHVVLLTFMEYTPKTEEE